MRHDAKVGLCHLGTELDRLPRKLYQDDTKFDCFFVTVSFLHKRTFKR